MDRKKLYISIILIISSVILLLADKSTFAQFTFVSKLKGKILLQVEKNGEAWYIYPSDQKKYYLGRPEDAFWIMRSLSIGISNDDIKQIPIADSNFDGIDSDNDGLSDTIEASIGTDINKRDTDNDGFNDKEEILSNNNPLDQGVQTINSALTKKLSGYIVLQVEKNGEAWYINPDNSRRYFLGRPSNAFNIMRQLGLGITNSDLAKIESYNIAEINNAGNNSADQYTKVENGKNIYTDPNNKYSFALPNGWSVKKYSKNFGITQLSDSKNDYILEKKGIISLNYFTTEENTNVNIYRIATKGISKTVSDEKIKINDFDAYENSYEHPLAFEKTVTIQIDEKHFIQATLATAKIDNELYIKTFDDLISSMNFN